MSRAGLRVKVRGIVQGVGFRPYVYALAVAEGLDGWVRNTSAGVEIELSGEPANLQTFVQTLRRQPPPLAKIDVLQEEAIPAFDAPGFSILESRPKPGDFLPVSPDKSICPDCQRELFDSADRRYRYPFINCTNCGPRFSIIRDIPYDRPLTTMAGFGMCPACREEYENPLDRRFHAQPTACPVCGPGVWLQVGLERAAEGDSAIRLARAWLKEGKILAVKGLGGFHIACDASNPASIAELRRRKRRSEKPFALMAFDLKAVEKHCQVTESDLGQLTSLERPVVLLQRRSESTVAAEAAPNLDTLGFMLAYTPLHLLLLEPEPGYPEALVMTSGNLSEEPIAYEDADAVERLSPLVDAFLLHDRPIHMRVDDSVTSSAGGVPIQMRRARGFAPDPVRLNQSVPSLLAAGAELKNTFCLARGEYAFLSHHIGDLENFETLRSFEEGVRHYERLFRIQPERLICDLHPDYLASRYAAARAEQEGLPLIQVQHHHAHLAACLADNGWEGGQDDLVIGLILDGTGMGTDGAVWGGEILLGNYHGFQRAFHLREAPLPGGDLAARSPARMALAHLHAAGLPWEAELPPVQALCYEERTALRAQIELGINTPHTTSMGRLFDAAAALAGLRFQSNYEAQAAIEFEAAADPDATGAYLLAAVDGTLDPTPLLDALLSDWRAGESVGVISSRFHRGVAESLSGACRIIRERQGLNLVALSGGVWQNRLLLRLVMSQLEKDGFKVLVHHQTPANDGGLALGQALIGAHAAL